MFIRSPCGVNLHGYSTMSSDSNELTPMGIFEALGLSQEKIGALVGVRAATVSDWKLGKTIPHLTPSAWLILLYASGRTPEELVQAFEPDELDLIPLKLRVAGLSSET